MQSGREELQKKVSFLEAQEIKRNEALLSSVSSLDDFLEAAYSIRCPQPNHYESRQDLIRICNAISRKMHGNEMGPPVVKEFGSFLMNMFTPDSDLDLSINLNGRALNLSRKAMQKVLRKFAKKFSTLQRRGIVRNVQLILSARVPVLKVTDCGTDIECDFSVENRDGVAKSHTVLMIAAIDERFRKLSIMMKAWAKAQGINCSREGTLNSMSLILFSAFHLQRSEPPILPPFSDILRGGHDPQSVEETVSYFLNYGRKNNDSLARLFVTLLIRLWSVKTLWGKGLCSSVYEGAWIRKTGNKFITVEDFTDRSQNVARAVAKLQFSVIYERIEKSLLDIRNFVDGKIDVATLEGLLFGFSPHMTKHLKNSLGVVLHDPTHTTKFRSGPEDNGQATSRSEKRGKKRKQRTMAENADIPGTVATNLTQRPFALQPSSSHPVFSHPSQSKKAGKKKKHGKMAKKAVTHGTVVTSLTQHPRATVTTVALQQPSSSRPVFKLPPPSNLSHNPAFRPVNEFPRARPNLPRNPPSLPGAGFPQAHPNPSWNAAPRPAIDFSRAQVSHSWNPPVAGFPHAQHYPWNPRTYLTNEYSRAPPNPSWYPPPQQAFDFRARPNPPCFPPGVPQAPSSGQGNTGQLWPNNPAYTGLVVPVDIHRNLLYDVLGSIPGSSTLLDTIRYNGDDLRFQLHPLEVRVACLLIILCIMRCS